MLEEDSPPCSCRNLLWEGRIGPGRRVSLWGVSGKLLVRSVFASIIKALAIKLERTACFAGKKNQTVQEDGGEKKKDR